MQYEGGDYVMYLWVPSNKNIREEEEHKVPKGNNFATMATEQEETKKDFIRRAQVP